MLRIKICFIQIITFFICSFLILGPIAPVQGSQKIDKNIAPLDTPFEMPQLGRPQFPDETFNISNYGARKISETDNDFLNTSAIHKAIKTCSEAGGGTVFIPKGEWLTGPIHLESHVNLHIDKGAIVHFTTDKEEYLPVVPVRKEGVRALNYSPLIYAYEKENIAITGKGTLHGHGQAWWKWYRDHGERDGGDRLEVTKVPYTRRIYGKGGGVEGMRPNFFVPYKSKNILVEGVTFKQGPMWNINPTFSKNIIVRDVTVESHDAPNGDGVSISSCINVLVEYCHFKTGDDAVPIKSGLNEEGLKLNRPSKNIVVRNIQAEDVPANIVTIGSETSGGIENVYFHNATINGAERGIRIKSERGRGNVIKNIYVEDIDMQNITDAAIQFTTYYSGGEGVGPAPIFRDIYIKNVTARNTEDAIEIIGLPEQWIQNITLENIEITNSNHGGKLNRVKNFDLENVRIEVNNGPALTIINGIDGNLKENVFNSESAQPSILLKGEFIQSIMIDNSIPVNNIKFGPDVSKSVIKKY